MIVRIQGEGQYELSDDQQSDLEDEDLRLFTAIDSGDEEGFHAALRDIVDFIRSSGSKVPDDRITPSDAILPSPDTSLDEAKRLFTDEGLLQPVDA